MTPAQIDSPSAVSPPTLCKSINNPNYNLYLQSQPMLEPTEQSLVKIDALISGIRMINLHVYNYLCEHSNPRARDPHHRVHQSKEQFKRLNLAHFKEHMRFISDYLKKCLKDMAKTRVSLSPLIYRSLRSKILTDEDFLRFQNHNYGVKFIFTDLLKEYLMNIEIYRKVQGTRIGGAAMRKLQMTFLYDIYCRYPDSQFTIKLLQQQGAEILKEVTIIFSGQKCASCDKHLSLNSELMAFMPPTVRQSCDPREPRDLRDQRDQRDPQREPRQGRKNNKYFHQSCL